MKRISQKEAIFYKLWQHAKSGSDKYIPVFELMGEIFCREAGKWGYVSYECSARASEMIKENPGLILRTWLRGKSGAKYYGYRFSPQASVDRIKDEKLVAFYHLIGGKRKSEREQALADNRRNVAQFDREWAAERAAKTS